MKNHETGTGPCKAELHIQWAMSQTNVCHYNGQKDAWIDEHTFENCSRYGLLCGVFKCFQEETLRLNNVFRQCYHYKTFDPQCCNHTTSYSNDFVTRSMKW